MKALITAALAALTGTAMAHVSLDQPEAPAGSSYRAVFKIGHGCEGGAATKEIVVTLPEGQLRGAKPQPKAGWTLTTGPALACTRAACSRIDDTNRGFLIAAACAA